MIDTILTVLSSCLSWGGLTLVSNLAFTVVGFSDQARVLHTTKNSHSISLRMYVLLVLTLLVTLAHFAFEQFDPFVAIPATVQLGFALLVTGQILYYRRYPGGRRSCASSSIA
jgi:hypothetical protein